MAHEPYLFFGLAITVAVLFGTIGGKLGLPKVAIYILTGAIFSRELLGTQLYPHGDYWADGVGTLALSFIGFQIGVALSIDDFRRHGKMVILGTIGNSLGAVLFVFCSILVVGSIFGWQNTLQLGLVLGAIAATTAPAGTIAVIHQYKAKGPFTKNLLSLVILDDAFGVIVFALLTSLFISTSWLSSSLMAIGEVLGSIALGSIIGTLFGFAFKRVASQSLAFPLLIGLFFITLAASSMFHLSSILMAMFMGFSTRAITKTEPFDGLLEKIEEFVYITLFVLAGCHFEISVFTNSLPLLITYIVFRSIGKYAGAYWGLSLGDAPKLVKKYTGYALIPQAGVAIGLALSLSGNTEFSNIQSKILNVVIGSTMIYEFIGPFLTKHSLKMTREIDA